MFFQVQLTAQCSVSEVSDTISTNSIWQTHPVSSLSAYQVDLVAGEQLHLSFCQGGGNALADFDFAVFDSLNNLLNFTSRGCPGSLAADAVFTALEDGRYKIVPNVHESCSVIEDATLAFKKETPTNTTVCSANTILLECNELIQTSSNLGVVNTGDASTCQANPNNSVWYRVLVPSTNALELKVITGSLSELEVSVFSGPDCNSLTEEACQSSAALGQDVNLTLAGLQANSYIYVQVAGIGGKTGSFGISAHLPVGSDCFTINGSASKQSCDCYQITPAQNSQSGSIWNKTQIDLSFPFDFEFLVYFGNKNGGADGMSFVLQQVSNNVGAIGGGVGYRGISPSIGVVMDTYNNGGDPRNNPGDDANGTKDPIADHMSIHQNGDVYHEAPNQLDGPIVLPNIEDGNQHVLQVSWDPSTQQLTAQLDNNPVLNYTGDIINNIFGGNAQVYWGFASSTGGLNNEHAVCMALLPDFTISDEDKIICLGDSLIFQDITTSFFGIKKWNWDFGDGTSSSLPNPSHVYQAAGNYTIILEITDKNDCVRTISYQVDVLDSPLIEVESDSIACNESSTTPVVTGNIPPGSTYKWDGPQAGFPSNANSVSISDSGTYSLVVSNPLGCSDTAFFHIALDTVIPELNLIDPILLNCNHLDTTLNATLKTPDPDVVITWNTENGVEENPVFIDSEGTVIVSATGLNGCTTSVPVEVVLDTIQPKLPDLEDGELNCEVLELIYSAVSTIGQNPSFEWDGPNLYSQEESITIDEKGIYRLIATDINGCFSNLQFEVIQNVQAPIIDVQEADILTCSRTTVNLFSTVNNGEDYEVKWTGPSIQGNEESESITVNGPGTYTVQYTFPNGCQNTSEIVVERNNTQPFLETVSPINLDCLNPSANTEITYSPDVVSFKWLGPGITTPKTTESILVSQEGVYTIEVQAENGCKAIGEITVNVDKSVEANAGINQLISCKQDTAVLDGSASTGNITKYQWKGPTGSFINGKESPISTVSKIAVYTLEVTADNGCVSTDEVEVVADTSSPLFQFTNQLNLTCSIDSRSVGIQVLNNKRIDSIIWNSAAFSDVKNQDQLNISDDAVYLATVYGENGCFRSKSIQLQYDTIRPDFILQTPHVLSCDSSSIHITYDSISIQREILHTWSGPGIIGAGNTSNVQVNSTGNYQLLITYPSNGCSHSGFVSVGIDTLRPSIQLNTPLVLHCNQLEVDIQANLSQLQSEVIAWNGPSILSDTNQNSIRVDASGIYRIEVMNSNGCSESQSIEVFQDIAPVAIVNTPDTLNCIDTIQSLFSTASTGLNLRSYWEYEGLAYASNIDTINVRNGGKYQLTIIDKNFCESQVTVTVEQDTVFPIISILPADTLTCNRLEVELDASNSVSKQAQFEWSGNGIVNGKFSPNATVNLDNTFSLVVTNDNGCKDSSMISVPLDTLHPVIQINSNDTFTCEGQPILIHSEEQIGRSSTVQWINGSYSGSTTSSSVLGNAFGPFTVEYTFINNGCFTQSTFQAEVDTVAPILSLTVLDTLDCITPFADVELEVFSAHSIESVIWSPMSLGSIGSNNLQFIASESGLLTAQVKVGNGCIGNSSIFIPIDTVKPTAIAESETYTIEFNEEMILDGTNSIGKNLEFSWESDSTFMNSNSAIAIIQTGGEFTLQVTSSNGCIDTDIIRIVELPNEGIIIPNAMVIGRNFKKGFWPTTLEHTTVNAISVFNRWGELIFSSENEEMPWKGTHDGKMVSIGVYSVVVDYTLHGQKRIATGNISIIR